MKKSAFSIRTVNVIMLVFFFLAISSVKVFAWGREGHKVIAEIAEHYMNAKARKEVRSLLAVIHQKSIADIASWADEYRRSHPETGRWHYVDIPLNATHFDSAQYCKDGGCVVYSILRFEKELANKHLSAAERAKALKFVVHFVGDITQPLHCADNHDKGGNEVKVTFFGHPFNLHRVWDYGIIEHTGLDARQYSDYLIKKYHPDYAQRERIDRGTTIDWAMESHKEAVRYAYGDKPADNKLGERYYNECLPVVNHQLFIAGVRLANVLNRILG